MKKHKQFNHGSVLVVTIWILMILSLIAVGFSYRMGIELKLVKYHLDDLKSFYIAKAGIYRTIAEIQNDYSREYDAYKDNWGNNKQAFKNIPLGEGSFIIKNTYQPEDAPSTFLGASDEQSKININTASVETLNKLFTILDEDPDIATNIMDWIDQDSTPGNHGDGFGAEDGYYESLGKKYPCKNKPIEIPEELLMVKDVTPEIFKKIKDLITIYGDGTININTATPLTLECLGFEESLIEKIIEYRAGEDQLEGTYDDNIFQNLTQIIKELDDAMDLDNKEKMLLNNILAKKPCPISIKSEYFRIISKGTSHQITKTIEAIVKRRDKQYAEILFWKES